MTAAVTPIRPGMECKPDIRYIHALPPGLSLLELQDSRASTGAGDLRLQFEVSGGADAIVAAGIVTREMLGSIPKCGYKNVRSSEPINSMVIMRRRKADYRVSVCLYDDDNPLIPGFVAMFGLRRKAPEASLVTRGGIEIGKMWDQLGREHRLQVELSIKGLLAITKR